MQSHYVRVRSGASIPVCRHPTRTSVYRILRSLANLITAALVKVALLKSAHHESRSHPLCDGEPIKPPLNYASNCSLRPPWAARGDYSPTKRFPCGTKKLGKPTLAQFVLSALTHKIVLINPQCARIRSLQLPTCLWEAYPQTALQLRHHGKEAMWEYFEFRIR